MAQTLEVKLWSEMVRFVRCVRRQANEAAGEISPAKFFMLSLLHREGTTNQATLSAQMGATAANTSQRLRALEDAGLVTRTTRGREKLVSITRRGRGVVAREAPKHDDFIASCFRALSKKERRDLLALLSRLLDASAAAEAD